LAVHAATRSRQVDGRGLKPLLGAILLRSGLNRMFTAPISGFSVNRLKTELATICAVYSG